jgi:hypothetical protein
LTLLRGGRLEPDVGDKKEISLFGHAEICSNNTAVDWPANHEGAPWLGLVGNPKVVHDDGGTNPGHDWPLSGAMEGVATGALRLLDISSLVMWVVTRLASKKDEGRD